MFSRMSPNEGRSRMKPSGARCTDARYSGQRKAYFMRAVPIGIAVHDRTISLFTHSHE
jgi:hypothetical protein